MVIMHPQWLLPSDGLRCSVCCCAMSKSLDSSCACWWNRREPWPTASYIRSHTAIAELVAVTGLIFTERLWTVPHCSLNFYSSYVELPTTHSQWRLLIHHPVAVQLPHDLQAHLNGLCYVYVFQYSEHQWTQQYVLLTQLNLGQLGWEWTLLTCQPHPMSSWEDTHSTTTNTSFLHSFWDSTLVCIPHHSSSTTRLQWHIPTWYFRRSSSRPSCV